jgi:hypothetical protein
MHGPERLMPHSIFAFFISALVAVFPAWNVSAQDSPDFEKLTDQQIEEMVQFVVGNGIFILYHEAGHMLVSEFDLPVLGREEDAVDNLSSILMLEADDDLLDQAIIDAADGWFLSSEAAADAEEEQAFWGAHGLDEQRGWAIACSMAGHDYKNFKEFIDSLEFPEDRREECISEYPQKVRSWNTLLKPHEATANASTKFEVTYEPITDPSLELFQTIVKESKLLELIGNSFSDLYNIKDGIKLTAKQCGQANAFWSPKDREITFCYEFAKFHGELVANYFLNNAADETQPQSETESDDATVVGLTRQ